MLEYIDFSICNSLSDIIDTRLTNNNTNIAILPSITLIKTVLSGFEPFLGELREILSNSDINEEISEITDNLLIHSKDIYNDIKRLYDMPDTTVCEMQKPLTELIDMMCKIYIGLYDIYISNEEYTM